MNHSLDPDELAGVLLNGSPDGLLLIGADGIIRLANAQADHLFGRELDGLGGTPVDLLVPAEQRSGHPALRERYGEHPARRPMGTDLRLLGEAADGSLFPVEISLSPVTIDGEACTIATVRDVSERQETMARVALLKDRERIARDIHDMVIQRLFAAGMSLQAITGLVESPVVSERLMAVTDDLDATIRQLRQSIFQLGQDDHHLSLSSHIAAVVNERSHHLGFSPDLHISGKLEGLADFVGDQLIATLTEALSNVARHARASGATVEVTRTDAGVSLKIGDDGVGMTGTPKSHGGLSNMMWRAAELGGTCSVASVSPSGTLLTWNVPAVAASRNN
ncbi:MAG: PAS domain S-box-containing protein [Ilumatobacter sp.]|jgi:PAS domain S-box-containing protein